MPGLYGITSNANISVYNTTGLYNVGNTNVVVKGNVTVSNTPGLYQGLGNPIILTNAQQLYNLLDETGNVQFALTNGNTTVQAFTANIGTPAGTYGDSTHVPVVTVGADGRVTSITTIPAAASSTYSNANVAAYLTTANINTTGNIGAAYFTGNGYFLTGIASTGSTYSNANVAAYLPINSANVAAPYFLGNGYFLTGITAGSTYSNANVAAYLPTYSGAFNNSSTIIAINANVTAANTNIQTLSANVGAYETWANGQFTTFSANSGAYQTWANGQIQTINANIGAFETYANLIFSGINANITAANLAISNLQSNAATQETEISGLRANITAANATIQTISANLGAYETWANSSISAINANVTAANATIQTISANLGAYETWANGRISTLDANLGTATTNITTLFANAATQAVQINSINANVTAINVAISGLQANVYSNANVASYLPTYGGNLNPGNVVISGNLTVNGTTTSINYNEYVAGLLVANSTTAATSTTSGALQVKGGAGIVGNVVAGAFYSNLHLYANGQAYAGTYTNSNVTNLLSGGTYGGDIQALSGVVTAAAINSTGASSATTYVQAGQGLYSIGTFSGTYSDGIVVDYTTGNGRISVGTADSITFYSGGPGTTPTAVIYPNGNVVMVGSATAANLITTGGVYWANGTIYGGTYSNANVSAYLASGTDPTINAINANITAANSAIQTLNANVGAYETWANSVITSQVSNVTTLMGNVMTTAFQVSRISGDIYGYYANVGTIGTNYPTIVSTDTNYYTYQIAMDSNASVAFTANTINNLTLANGATISGQVTTVSLIGGSAYLVRFIVNRGLYPWFTTSGSTSFVSSSGYYSNSVVLGQYTLFASNASLAVISANLGAYELYANSSISAINANVTAANVEIGNLRANITAANSTIQTLSANVGAYETWANISFNSLASNANANVAAYLLTNTGNIASSNFLGGNVYASKYFWANGVVSTYGNADWTARFNAVMPITSINFGGNVVHNSSTEPLGINNPVTYTGGFGGLISSGNTAGGYVLPQGTTAQRGVAWAGTIRYNTDLDAIEWSNAASTWTTLGSAGSSYGNTQVAAYLPTYSGNIGATLTNGTQPYITSVGTLSTLNVTGNISGLISTSSQPYIHSIGTLSSLNVTGGIFGGYLQTGLVNGGVGIYGNWGGSGLGFGLVADYSSNVGRLTVGPTETISFYANNSIGGGTPTASIISNGAISAGNVITTNGVFWSNGVAYATSGGSYGNTQVAAYLPTDPTITAIQANVTAANASIQTISANVGAYETWANANFYKSGSSITVANVVTTAGVFWSNGVAYSTGGGSYGNTQVAAYLPIYAGNISAANLYATSANVTGLVYFGSSYKETVYAFGTTSGTINANLANGTVQTITLNGNMTLNTTNFVNMGPGQSVTLVIRQDATGGRTLTSNISFAGNAKTLTNAASAVDTLSVFYDGTSYLGALVKGYV